MRLLLCLLGCLCFANAAQAHRFAPSSLQIIEGSDYRYEVLWKTPMQTTSNTPLIPVLPSECVILQASEPQLEGTAYVQRWSTDCGAYSQGLIEQDVRVDGLAQNQASAIVSLTYQDRRSWQSVLSAEQTFDTIPTAPTAAGVLGSYIVLGGEHIWAGPDHLLFVLGLVLLVSGMRSLLITITAFTVGHSITLALVTLGVFDYPVSLVEFLIALSIFMLALEVNADTPGWFARFPWAVAVGFGLLHGMGFAGALAEVGLPQGQVPLALLSFNIGIELGQILFVLLILTLGYVLKHKATSLQQTAAPVAIYGMGGIAAMWCIERGLSVLGV